MRNDENPTLWRDLSDAEKGALLLARHEGKLIEYFNPTHKSWHEPLAGWVSFDDMGAYRIEPRVVKRMWTGTVEAGFGGTDDLNDTHMITFNTIDGEPDLLSIKMEKI